VPNVNVTYQEMRDAGRRLANGQTEIENKLAELSGLVTSLVNGGYVTDSSSKSFETAYLQFTQGAKSVIAGLNDMNVYLHAAADKFEKADAELAAQLKGR
jgi:WXG100 family type VII secretion target